MVYNAIMGILSTVQNGNNSKKREFTALKIIEALHASHGLLTLAAKKAGVNYKTVCRYVAEFPSVAQAVVDAKEAMLDFAEGKLYEQISKNNMTAIIFYMKTQGKARGYIERQEFTGEGGKPIGVDIDAKGKLLSAINRFAARTGEAESNQQSEQ